MSTPTARATRGRRSALLVIAALVGTVAARSVHLSMLIDACLDAGGRYLPDPARCDVATGAARALTEMPQRPGWWVMVVASGLAAGALAFLVGRALLARTVRTTP